MGKQPSTNRGPRWHTLAEISRRLPAASPSLCKAAGSVCLPLQSKLPLSFPKRNPILRQSETLQIVTRGGGINYGQWQPCAVYGGKRWTAAEFQHKGGFTAKGQWKGSE